MAMMAKIKYKNSKNKSGPVKKAKERKDPRIQEVYEELVTFNCPIRGVVTQKVKIKRYRTQMEQESKHLLTPLGEIVDKLEEQDNGLSIYNDGEELGVKDGPSE